MLFVDTGAWFALAVPTDPSHRKIRLTVEKFANRLITTDYVVDETLTLLRARGEPHRAIEMGYRFFDGRLARIYTVSESTRREAWEIFRKFADKDWSFTDCTSKAVIEELGIQAAIALDRHFLQFGTITVLPL